jgi:hypothetical protein
VVNTWPADATDDEVSVRPEGGCGLLRQHSGRCGARRPRTRRREPISGGQGEHQIGRAPDPPQGRLGAHDPSIGRLSG